MYLTIALFQYNIVDLLSDTMYSDADQVLDALADLIDLVIPLSDDDVVSEGRMNQVRHLLKVDEAEFRSNFSPGQLNQIEIREIGAIVEELVSAIGLQRFRFSERQNNGRHITCQVCIAMCFASHLTIFR